MTALLVILGGAYALLVGVLFGLAWREWRKLRYEPMLEED